MDRRNEEIRNENVKEDRRGERNDSHNHLIRLDELDDYKVASDDPDVRGWVIVDRDNHEFGVIEELIVDPEREKVRYLDVVQNPSGSKMKGDDHLLIPIGVARIDHDGERVLVNDFAKDFLSTYPSHKGETITRDYELLVIDKFNHINSAKSNVDKSTTSTDAGTKGDNFYDNHFYDENSFYKNRKRTQ